MIGGRSRVGPPLGLFRVPGHRMLQRAAILPSVPAFHRSRMHRFADPVVGRLAGFLREIGLEVEARDLPGPCFLPGVRVDRGRLLVDEARLLHPGDLLHEAGHLAIVTAAERAERHDDVGADLGEEIGAIAWSYAAAVHLGIDPAVVFHPHGYRGASAGFLDNFRHGRYVGVPLLQWMDLTLDEKHARERGVPPYPHMLRWLRG